MCVQLLPRGDNGQALHVLCCSRMRGPALRIFLPLPFRSEVQNRRTIQLTENLKTLVRRPQDILLLVVNVRNPSSPLPKAWRKLDLVREVPTLRKSCFSLRPGRTIIGNSLSSENLAAYAEILRESRRAWEGIMFVPLKDGLFFENPK